MILPAHSSLYRYDLKKPPSQWSVDFHEYHYVGYGFKNISGSFFFYDNIEDCHRTSKNEKDFNGYYYLTLCHNVREINLLDIRAKKMMGILTILYENNINVLVPEFNTYSLYEVRPLSTISYDFEIFLHLLNNKEKNSIEDCKQLNLANKIADFIEPQKGNNNFRYLGQLLTDFDNGPVFKRMLIQKGFDGYMFYEHDIDTPCVTSYCIFESSLLSSPICKIIRF